MSARKEDQDPALLPTQTRMTDTQTANTEPAPSDSSLKQPVDEMLSQRIGQYRVVRRIGRGGMGVVYEAVHETIGQRIAVKTLNQELSANPAFVKRFLTEARATVIAQHPGLVKVFDYGQIPDGPLYLQMEYLEGETLAKRLLKTGKLPIETTIRWIRQIASAMALAHARDIVHRDLKPDNIFLVPDHEVDGGERIKILDFGLAKILSPEGATNPHTPAKYTSMGGVVGTPAYMAPEQFRGESSLSGQADVYSLGVILFELLTGELPFAANTMGDLMLQHLTHEPPPVRRLRSEVPASLAALCRRMLDKDAQARPSMAELERVLGDVTHNEIPTSETAVPQSQAPPVAGAAGEDRTDQRTRVLLAISVISVAVGIGALWRAAIRWQHGSEMVTLSGGLLTKGSTQQESRAALLWCQRLVSDGCREEFFSREVPSHQVQVAPFSIDRREVTNKQFAAWLNQQVDLRVDSEPRGVYLRETLLTDLFPNFGSGGIDYQKGKFVVRPGLERRPATQLTWFAADAYCHAHGKRLPSEVEWEFAARSGQHFQFPWGDDEPRCEGVVFARHNGWACGHLSSGPEDVGTSKQDRSAQGVLDLAGNVSEWVADRFVDATLAGQDFRVVRGGDWHTPAAMCRSPGRSRVLAGEVAANIGFRCAK